MATEITRLQPYGSLIWVFIKGNIDSCPVLTKLQRVKARNIEACTNTYHHICQGAWHKFFFFNISITSVKSRPSLKLNFVNLCMKFFLL